VLAVICGCTSASGGLLGAETLDWVMPSLPVTAAMLAVILYFSADWPPFVRAGNYHINARKSNHKGKQIDFFRKTL
jgi:hypothetical protein